MKIMIRLLSVGATVSMLALSTWANSLSTSYQDQCTPENKDAWYATFTQNYKGDQQKAYDAAKKYLGCFPEETDQSKYLKKFVAAYDKASRKGKFAQLLYTDHKYPEAYALGREILADEPDNLTIIMHLGANGYLAKDPAVNAESVNYAKKAIELLGSGKTVEDWLPFKGAGEALAYLNYNIGALTVAQDPSGALSYLIKAAKSDTDLKKSAPVYGLIAAAYETGPYAKQSEAYKQYQGKDETPESKLALANINQIIDRMIDGYARAVAAAGTDSKYAAQKPGWTESLSTWYKYRNGDKTDGMDAMVAGIMSKPLPPEPTPITTLPASTPAATPASNSGSGTTAATTTTTTTKPATPNNTPPGTNKPATPATGAPAKPSTGPGRPGRNNLRN